MGSFRHAITREIAIVLALLLFALVQFVRERWPRDRLPLNLLYFLGAVVIIPLVWALK